MLERKGIVLAHDVEVKESHNVEPLGITLPARSALQTALMDTLSPMAHQLVT